MSRNMIIGCMILGLLVCTQPVGGTARYDYELAYGEGSRDSEYRNAADMDDWLERGHASVTESPVFSDGIRLIASASGGEGAYEPGLASAIYHFDAPRWAQYLKVTVRYRATAQHDKIAGRLWIKSAATGADGPSAGAGEAPLYGDTFVLRADQTSETIIVPSSRHVEADSIEMHIVAEGQECLDIQYVRVDYLKTTPAGITVVHRAYNDYWDQWPRYRYVYHYYYWGPFYWPRTYVTYECWDVPEQFYWVTWRPWFHIFTGGFHSHPWWEPRRYTVIYHKDLNHPPATRRTILRGHLRERHEHATPITQATPVMRETPRSPVQARPSRNQEIRLKKEGTEGPRTFESRGNQNSTQKHVQEQPVREDKQRKSLAPNIQDKTVKSREVVRNKPDVRAARPSSTGPPQIQNDHAQPQTTGHTSRPIPVAKEAVHKPTSAPPRQDYRARQEQPVQRPAKIVKETVPQPSQETRQPRAQNEVKVSQPKIAERQSQPAPLVQEAVEAPARDHTPQDYRARQEQPVERPATMRQETTPRSQQEGRQPRSYGGKRDR